MEDINVESEILINEEVRSITSVSYSEAECQYLQMMQNIIQRMASNSFMIKNWTISIMVAFLALGCKVVDLNYWLFLTLIPIFIFWYLDGYYLKLERQLLDYIFFSYVYLLS